MMASTFLSSVKHRPALVQVRTGLLDLMRQVGDPSLINLAAGVPAPDLLPVLGLKKAFNQATRNVGRGMWAYQTPEGHLPLRRTMAERLSGRGVKVRGEEVIVTTGCTQALHLALRCLVNAGDVVACESPCYYNTLEQIADRGAQALPLPCAAEGGLIFEGAEKILRRYRPKVLVLCSTLSNPTGATMPEEDRPRWVALARQLGMTILEDDIYGELSEGKIPQPLRAYDDGSTVIYVSSYCKTVSPGLRVGCIVPGQWFEQVAAAKCMADIHGSLVSEATLDAYLNSADMERHLVKLRRICRRKRKLARETILKTFPQGTRVSDPCGGYMLWVELLERVDLGAVARKARTRGVSFASGDAFACAEPAVSAMRINCARVQEGELVAGLEKLGKLLNDIKSH
jgi:DNA-binding transcriptional MocR family regulator